MFLIKHFLIVIFIAYFSRLQKRTRLRKRLSRFCIFLNFIFPIRLGNNIFVITTFWGGPLTTWGKPFFFFCIRPPLGLLPVLGPLEWYVTPTLEAALLISSRAGADLGQKSVYWMKNGRLSKPSHHGWMWGKHIACLDKNQIRVF